MEEINTYIYGRNAVFEALLAKKTIEKIFVAFGVSGEIINRIYGIAKNERIPCVTSDKRTLYVIEKEMGLPHGKSQGIVALMRPFETFELQDLINKAYDKNDKPVLVVLDGIEDPQNLGAIARTAECAGLSGLILPMRNTAPISPVAIKASAGALELLPISKVINLNYCFDLLKQSGFWIVGTDSKGNRQYTDKIYDSPIAIVIGSEGKGMRPSTLNACDFVVKIPILGRINSLNASVSAGVIMYEISRQRSDNSSGTNNKSFFTGDYQ